MNRPTLIATILASALCTGFSSPRLLAATPIDQTRALDPQGRVEIDNLKGRIQVRSWPRNEVHISGSLGEGVEKLVIEGDHDHLVVRVQYPKQLGLWRGGRSGPSDLVLQVPLRANLDIQSVSGDVDVDGVAPGHLRIETVSGNVVATGAPQHADINSVSGDLRVTVNSADVKVGTVSGDVALAGRLNGQVHGETVSGKLSINSASINPTSINPTPINSMPINSMPINSTPINSTSIKSMGERVRWLSIGTVSGDVTVHAGLADDGEIKSESVSGDIHLYLPKTLSARVSGKSFSGTLRAPGAKIRKEEFGPGSSFEQGYGNGAGKIRIETFSGDAELVLE
jgi:DUF4097 and DUF4098 domain-containing protein YvlB